MKKTQTARYKGYCVGGPMEGQEVEYNILYFAKDPWPPDKNTRITLFSDLGIYVWRGAGTWEWREHST